MPPVTGWPDVRCRSSVRRLLHSRASAATRLAHVAELVAEVPRDRRRMPAQRAPARARAALRVEQRAGVDVARAVRDSRVASVIVRKRPAGASGRARPRRQPVHAAHVAAEQRRHRAQAGAAISSITRSSRRASCRPCVRRGLEIGPAQEEADAVEAEPGDAGAPCPRRSRPDRSAATCASRCAAANN
jgi:hypothetical protein